MSVNVIFVVILSFVIMKLFVDMLAMCAFFVIFFVEYVFLW